MLRCNMNTSSIPLQLGLESLLSDLQRARSQGDLGRLALLSYCEVRRWARMAGEASLAQHSSDLMAHSPHASRELFVAQVDQLIIELEQARARMEAAAAAGVMPPYIPGSRAQGLSGFADRIANSR